MNKLGLWLILWGALAMMRLLDGSPSMIFIKNHGGNAGIWIDGTYQGLAPGKQVCYIPREGFVTLDSGIQPDGSNKVTHAHAGWMSDGDLVLEATAAGRDSPLYTRQIIPASYSVAYVSLWSDVLPIREEEEFAVKLQNVGPPISLRSLQNSSGWLNRFSGGGKSISFSEKNGRLEAILNAGSATVELSGTLPAGESLWLEGENIKVSAELVGNELTLSQGSTKVGLRRDGGPGPFPSAVGPALSREVVDDAKFGTLYDSGGAGITELLFDPPPPQGARLSLYYDFFSIPDRITVIFRDSSSTKTVYDSRVVSGSGRLELPRFKGLALKVVVEGGSEGTAWEFRIDAFQ